MAIRYSFMLIVVLMLAVTVKAQIYKSDSLNIEIKSKNNFTVSTINDLNVEVVYSCKTGKRKVFVYDTLCSKHESALGNCYYKLFKYDSASGRSQDITFEVIKPTESPMGLITAEDWFTFDYEKHILNFGEQKTLTFNLLKATTGLSKGRYTMVLYVRIGDRFGYDEKGEIVVNSVQYLQSTSMSFDVLKEVHY